MQRLQSLLVSPEKERFFQDLSETGFADLERDLLTFFEGESDQSRPYVIFETLTVTPAFCKSIRAAAEAFWGMATSTAKVFQFLSEAEILDWGFPEDYLPQILANTNPPTEMRLDIAVNPLAYQQNFFELKDFKVLEANAATPGFWSETFVLNECINQYFQRDCPNRGLGKRHSQDFISYLNTYAPQYRHGQDPVYFSFPYAEVHEDILSFDARMGFFKKLGGKPEFRYVEDLLVDTEGNEPTTLYEMGTNQPIRYLFLHYPNEWLIEDPGEVVTDEAFRTIPAARPWDYLQEITLNNQLYRLPPISAEIIQNKAFFAWLWEGVHSKRFDFETTRLIQALIPQTYCTLEEAQAEGLKKIWEKPIYGREGAGIICWDRGVETVNTYDPDFEDDDWYQNMLAIFQADCPMPTHHFADAEVILMFTVYLSAMGQATGIGCRAVTKTHQVIDARHGMWLPLSV
jgi:glutathionylspermidine synthase